MGKCFRFISVILAVVFLVTSCPMTTFAADNEYQYTLALLDDGTVKIAKFTGNTTEIDIEADMKNYGYTVTAIGDAAFANNTTLEKITMPDTITSIGYEAFMYCTKLKDITLSQNITLLDWNVFEGCYSLDSIVIPEGVETIDYQAFNNCSALKSVSIPKTVKIIEAQAFKDCTALTDVYYSGSESDWNNINISSTANNWLTSATKHFSFCGIKQVALGGYHSAAVTDDGDLYMWGDNSSGQLGNGTTVDSSTPIKILENVKSVELGNYHSAAITNDGELYMWGCNTYGALGIGTEVDSSIPVKVMSNVASVVLPKDSQTWRVAAITESNDLYMWGYNSSGELGNGSTSNCSTPQKILSNVAKVEFGACHTAAITTSGNLYMWGNNGTFRLGDKTETNRSTPVSILSGVSDVKLGTENSAAITTSGVMYTWGSNWYGQIGMNNHTAYARTVPYAVLSNVKEIALADNTTVAVTNAGELYTWGWLRFETFGPDDYDYAPVLSATNVSSFISSTVNISVNASGYIIDNNNQLLPFSSFNEQGNLTGDPLDIESVKFVCTNYDGTYAALTENSELYMWGDNSSGQIGIGTTSESEAITKVVLNSSDQDDAPSNDPVENFTPNLKYGADRLSFGENITGYVGETLDTLVVYTTKEENIASLDISSSNSAVVEIGTIVIGNGEYITGKNECIATIPLNLKAVGTSTITITSPEGVSESVVVTVEDVCYEVKAYSNFPTLVIDKNSSSIIGLQTERNGEVWNDECKYTIAVSNSNIVTTSNLEYTSDGGAYLTLNGHNEGMAKITITESKSGAVFSTTISVVEQILTYNAAAFKNASVDDLGCNGFVSGMYIDEFVVSEPVNNCYPVLFSVYNSKNIVGVVEVYDSSGQLKEAKNINRFDGGTVTSIQDIFVSGWEVFEDGTDGILGTYKDFIHSEETIISVEIPIGGYIKITNDPTASETCAIYNCTEFLVNSYLLYGNVLDEVKGSIYSGTNEEIAKMVAESASKEVVADFINGKISSDEVDNKLNSMGTRLIAEFLEVTTESVSSNYLKGTADSFVEVCKLIFSESGIDIVELIQESAVSLGFSGLEQYVLDEVGLVGDIISATFMAAETHQYTGYVVALFGQTQYEEMDIHFNAVDGSLVSNGVSIKSENGKLALTESNFVMHSIVLSNEEALTSEIKQLLDDISNDYVVRDIYLERDGVVSQPGQTVQVYMPIPDNYDPNKCKLYWVKDDGTLESKDFTIIGDNIMFTTDHFSYWALVNESSVIEGQCGDNLNYLYDTSTYTLTITGEGDMWDWKPETTPWWNFKENINCVKIEKGVTNVGNFAFAGFTALSDLYLSDSISSIGVSAFALCTSLETIVLPTSINTINTSAFYNCKALTGITLPDCVVSLGDSVFGNCIKLESFVFPSNVTSMGAYLFDGCTSLCDVEFSESMNTIPSYAFLGCTGLKEIEIPTYITNVGTYAFRNCSNLEYVYIPSGITSIDSGVFMDCTNLKSIMIPDSVTSIGNGAFENCSSLTSVTIGNGVTSIGMNAFEDCTNIKNITIPSSVKTIASDAFLGCISLTSIVIPDSVTKLGSSAFEDCANLSSVVISNGITVIDSCVFSGCDKLTNVVVPDSVEQINPYAFYCCTSLDSIVLPMKVCKVLNNAFDKCSNLESVKILNSQVYFNMSVFNCCDKLVLYGYENSTTQTHAEKYGLSFVALENEEILLGDINGDGIVDAGDAVIVSRYDAGFITLTPEQLEAGDVNGDGAVDAGDAVIISRYDAGLISQIGY